MHLGALIGKERDTQTEAQECYGYLGIAVRTSDTAPHHISLYLSRYCKCQLHVPYASPAMVGAPWCHIFLS